MALALHSLDEEPVPPAPPELRWELLELLAQ